MSKSDKNTTLIVRDAKSGRVVEVRGVGALKSSKLSIRKDIDLTKPIASQVLNTQRKSGR